jgi:hypothetical protein
MLKISRALEVPVGYFMGAVDNGREEENDLGPREHRLLRAYRRISQDPRLQIELLHVVERVGLHIAKRGGRANRAAAV